MQEEMFGIYKSAGTWVWKDQVHVRDMDTFLNKKFEWYIKNMNIKITSPCEKYGHILNQTPNDTSTSSIWCSFDDFFY
jgi:hypothetical protein